MIFYFSGTGNSLYAARKIALEGEAIINVTEALESRETTFRVTDGEKVGFVFPVYFYTLNDVMASFVERLSLENADYVYAVVTCGASIGGTGSVLKKKLASKGVQLSNVFPLVMPDNGVLYYNISSKEQALEELKQSDAAIEQIKAAISRNEIGAIKSNFLTPILGFAYHCGKGTRKFYVTDACIGCGICEKNCQDHVIQLIDGRPKWIKKECTKCTACINGCPSKAIQYGHATEKRNRYTNPFV